MDRLDAGLKAALAAEDEALPLRSPSPRECRRALSAIGRGRAATRAAACFLAGFAALYAAGLGLCLGLPLERPGESLSASIERGLPADPAASIMALLGDRVPDR